ncbi:MAG: cardiolipin synthase [Pseudomonadota bacterium]|nr:cardiolipin synthase [Pseudomonadota bacterium]
MLVLFAHVSAAGLVTVHTLLRKRDVPAAIGWIGMAWLAPALGALLYFAFGINRVRRRARRLMRTDLPPAYAGHDNAADDSLTDLETAVGAVTRRPPTAGRVAAHLFCGDAAYPEMLAAIAAAKQSVRLATYIFRADEVGETFIAALAAAQRRGVKVNVLIDGFGGGFLASPAYRRLHQEGVEAARFLHSFLPWKMAFLNLRLHKKILAVDGEVAFVGGLNIAAENVLARRPQHPVCDHHFKVLGPIVNEIEREFDEDWQFATGKRLLRAAAASVPADAGLSRAISSGPDQETDHLVLVLLCAVNAARRTIRIATPYFLPDEQLVTALRLAALRGVAVDIVLPANNNHPFVAWAARAHVRPLIESGCRIWFNPPPFDHSKLMTIDSRWSLIGSANWDARSLRLNFELTVEFRDAALASEIERAIDARRGVRLTLSDLDSRNIVIKLRDAAIRLAMPYI